MVTKLYWWTRGGLLTVAVVGSMNMVVASALAQILGEPVPGIILSVDDVDTPGAPSIILTGGLEIGIEGFNDRAYIWTDVPDALIGADYIQSAQDNADVSDDRGTTMELDVEVVAGTILHLFLDNRLEDRGLTPFPWMNAAVFGMDWFDTGEQVDGTVADAHGFSVWSTVAPLPAGVYTFRQQPEDNSFYGIAATFLEIVGGLQAGDADQDLDFDQLDLVQVQVAAKYLTGHQATWGEGDWDGAPGGRAGSPPPGNGLFDQLDIIAALAAGKYLTGSYAVIAKGGSLGDGQTSIVYNVATGDVAVDAPTGVELTSVNIDSAASIFTGDAAANLGGSFDNDTDDNLFKATFGSSFGSISFGNVAQEGLSEDFVANDLTVVGSLAGGGALGNADLVYVPEPSTLAMLGWALLATFALRVPRGR